jgi:hypothetical protein
MHTTEATAAAKEERPIVLPPAPAAPAAEKTEESPAVTKEDSCCAVPAGRTGRWRPWLIGGAVILPIALWGGWDWLATAGLAPILVAVLPCAAMCALGLCMGRGKSKGDMTLADIRKTYETNGEPPGRG